MEEKACLTYVDIIPKRVIETLAQCKSTLPIAVNGCFNGPLHLYICNHKTDSNWIINEIHGNERV